MAAPDSVRKLAALAVIGVVIGTSAWLGPDPAPVRRVVLPHVPATFVAVLPPRLGAVQGRFKVDSQLARSPVGVRPERGRSAVADEPDRDRSSPGVSSEWPNRAYQLPVTSGLQKPSTGESRVAGAPAVIPATSLPIDASSPPAAQRAPVASPVASPVDNPVSRALTTAGHQTGDAFRTAGRAIRLAFQSTTR